MVDKLKEIDNAIRYHYFESDCSHVTYEACCRAILHKIIKITGYEERKTITQESQS